MRESDQMERLQQPPQVIPEASIETEAVSMSRLETLERVMRRVIDPSDVGEPAHEEVFVALRDPETYEVLITSTIDPEHYSQNTPEQDMDYLWELGNALRGKKVAFINSTVTGGGVAMMRPSAVNLMNKLGLDAHWYALEPDDDAVRVTKDMHNMQQRVAAPDVQLTDEKKATHQAWVRQNAEVLSRQEALQTADIIVIDDPQPSALIRHIKGYTDEDGDHPGFNPGAKLVYRNHIQTSREAMADVGSQANTVWSYLRDECGVSQVDAYVAHPVESFVPKEMDDKLVYIPAVSDPFHDLMRPLEQGEIEQGIVEINQQLTENEAQLPLDDHKDIIALFARFDPAKGMDIAMDLYNKVREKMIADGKTEAEIPDLVLIGNGAVDDPDGPSELARIMAIRAGEYGNIKDHIKVARLRHNYAAVNAFMRWRERSEGRRILGLQLSTAEGFENRVSDWMEHGIPVVTSNRGGIPLQVTEGQSGYVLDFDHPSFDLERGVDIITHVLGTPNEYEALCTSTKEVAESFNNREFGTVANVIRWLRVFDGSLHNPDIMGKRRWLLSDIVDEEARAVA